MDSITHIVVGACMGEVLAGRQWGRRALLWGAVAQSLPDADAVAALWMDLPHELLAHRGFTHSLLFVLLLTPLLAFLASRWSKRSAPGFTACCLFFGLELLVHLFLDGFNNYGTGWLEPFSHHRFSLNTLYVADPLITIWPLLATIVLFVLPVMYKRRRAIASCALLLSATYLAFALFNKWSINRELKQEIAAHYPQTTQYFSTPAPLNSLLWFVVLGNDSGYYAGYRSVFDPPGPTDLHYFPANHHWLAGMNEREDLRLLQRFSQGFYTASKVQDTLLFNDLRFGQVIGWSDPSQPFVFHYYLEYPTDNEVVVQRGRFAKWDRGVFQSLLRRMAGKK